jgi:hypothetical protein
VEVQGKFCLVKGGFVEWKSRPGAKFLSHCERRAQTRKFNLDALPLGRSGVTAPWPELLKRELCRSVRSRPQPAILSAIEIKNGGQIKPAIFGLDVGDVRYPDLVGTLELWRLTARLQKFLLGSKHDRVSLESSCPQHLTSCRWFFACCSAVAPQLRSQSGAYPNKISAPSRSALPTWNSSLKYNRAKNGRPGRRTIINAPFLGRSKAKSTAEGWPLKGLKVGMRELTHWAPIHCWPPPTNLSTRRERFLAHKRSLKMLTLMPSSCRG